MDARHLASPPNTRLLKLLGQGKRCIHGKHYSLRTEEAYVYWIRWFIRFHGLRHPLEMGVAEVKAFLSKLRSTLALADEIVCLARPDSDS